MIGQKVLIVGPNGGHWDEQGENWVGHPAYVEEGIDNLFTLTALDPDDREFLSWLAASSPDTEFYYYDGEVQ